MIEKTFAFMIENFDVFKNMEIPEEYIDRKAFVDKYLSYMYH